MSFSIANTTYIIFSAKSIFVIDSATFTRFNVIVTGMGEIQAMDYHYR